MFLRYNSKSQTKSKVQACVLKRKIVKATKRKYAMLCCVCVCLQDHWKCLFLDWWLEVDSKSPAPSLPSSLMASLPPYSCQEYLVNSNLRLLASQISSSCSWIVDCKNRKYREQEWKRTHRPRAIEKRVAHDICITANRALPSKAIRVVGIDWPRQMRRINKSTGSKALLT